MSLPNVRSSDGDVPGRPDQKNSALEMVSTPKENLLLIAIQGKRSLLMPITTCNLAARENAQKMNNLQPVSEIGGSPKPATGENPTQIMGGQKQGDRFWRKNGRFATGIAIGA